DHLMGSGAGLEQAWHKAPQRAGDEARTQCEWQLYKAWQPVYREPDKSGRQTACDDLALAADVEQTGAEAQSNGQAREHEWRGDDQRLRQWIEGMRDPAGSAAGEVGSDR